MQRIFLVHFLSFNIKDRTLIPRLIRKKLGRRRTSFREKLTSGKLLEYDAISFSYAIQSRSREHQFFGLKKKRCLEKGDNVSVIIRVIQRMQDFTFQRRSYRIFSREKYKIKGCVRGLHSRNQHFPFFLLPFFFAMVLKIRAPLYKILSTAFTATFYR